LDMVFEPPQWGRRRTFFRGVDVLVKHFPMKSRKGNTFTNYFDVRLLKQKPVLR
jgi:hypothetical protein